MTTVDFMTKEFTHEPDANRYALRIDGELASAVEYRTVGDAIVLSHTYTPPSHRGRGLAAEIVSFTVDDIEANTALRVVPTCWYVSAWFDRHPERAGLLSRVQ